MTSMGDAEESKPLVILRWKLVFPGRPTLTLNDSTFPHLEDIK